MRPVTTTARWMLYINGAFGVVNLVLGNIVSGLGILSVCCFCRGIEAWLDDIERRELDDLQSKFDAALNDTEQKIDDLEANSRP